MSDYRCPVCDQESPSSTERCPCGAVAAESGASVFALIAEDEKGGSTDTLGLGIEECRRALTHLLNHGSIIDREADPEVGGAYENLYGASYPFLERIGRMATMDKPRHRLREYCTPEDPDRSKALPPEVHLSPMEYILLRQLILSGRG